MDDHDVERYRTLHAALDRATAGIRASRMARDRIGTAVQLIERSWVETALAEWWGNNEAQAQAWRKYATDDLALAASLEERKTA